MRQSADDARVEELIVKYGDLAKKLAWKYWKKLSPATKMWVDPEDMIAEAHLCFVKTIREQYDPERASECTFVFWAISSVLLNFCISQQQGKRKGVTLSLDEAIEALAEEDGTPKFDAKYLGKADENIILREALDALSHVYSEAGSECKAEMRRWFGQNHREKARRSLYGKVWNAEFLYLAKKFHLSMEDCRLLMRSGICLA